MARRAEQEVDLLRALGLMLVSARQTPRDCLVPGHFQHSLDIANALHLGSISVSSLDICERAVDMVHSPSSCFSDLASRAHCRCAARRLEMIRRIGRSKQASTPQLTIISTNSTCHVFFKLLAWVVFFILTAKSVFCKDRSTPISGFDSHAVVAT